MVRSVMMTIRWMRQWQGGGWDEVMCGNDDDEVSVVRW